MPPLIESLVWLIDLVIAVGALLCFIDALIRPAQAFLAVDRQSKPFWLIILGLAAVVMGVGFRSIGILGILAAAAVMVYAVDVRPKIREITRGRS